VAADEGDRLAELAGREEAERGEGGGEGLCGRVGWRKRVSIGVWIKIISSDTSVK
jgi:hypothetical protein